MAGYELSVKSKNEACKTIPATPPVHLSGRPPDNAAILKLPRTCSNHDMLKLSAYAQNT